MFLYFTIKNKTLRWKSSKEFGNNLLIDNNRSYLPLLTGPIVLCFWPIVLPASRCDILNRLSQTGINSKDDITATLTRGYRHCGLIVLGTEADSRLGPDSHFGNGWIAIYRLRGDPEAVVNGANIGTELAMLRVNCGVGLIASGICETPSLFNSSIRFGEASSVS
jgi:hypothetical protein